MIDRILEGGDWGGFDRRWDLNGRRWGAGMGVLAGAHAERGGREAGTRKFIRRFPGGFLQIGMVKSGLTFDRTLLHMGLVGGGLNRGAGEKCRRPFVADRHAHLMQLRQPEQQLPEQDANRLLRLG